MSMHRSKVSLTYSLSVFLTAHCNTNIVPAHSIFDFWEFSDKTFVVLEKTWVKHEVHASDEVELEFWTQYIWGKSVNIDETIFTQVIQIFLLTLILILVCN